LLGTKASYNEFAPSREQYK